MKKKILIIIPGVPFPPVNGHKLKIFNLIKILSKHYDLHLVTISREELKDEELNFIKESSYKNAHFRINLISSFFRVLGSFLFSSKPIQVSYFESQALIKYLKKESTQDDFVFFNLIRSAGFIDLFENKFKIFDMVDLLSLSYKKSFENTNSRFYKLVYKLEGNRLDKYEKIIVHKNNLTICVNEDETNTLIKYGKVKWLPNGVNEKLFSYSNKSEVYSNCIAFIGAMYYQPNIDAIIWMDRYLLDYLNPSIKFYIVGPKPSKQIINIAKKRKNVIVTGFLDDPYLILNSCNAVVSPMQNGGGIQNKILEAMALGKVNILTSFCAEPIKGAKNGVHFIVEDNPILMADKINDVCENPLNFIDVESKAKKLIEENYTWNAYERKLIFELNNL